MSVGALANGNPMLAGRAQRAPAADGEWLPLVGRKRLRRPEAGAGAADEEDPG
jgi:hypothetical protein